jgi:ketosteroid isomerase-like protein
MRFRSIVALIGLASSFALPAFAQQEGTVDPQVVQQLRGLDRKTEEAYKKGDATARAALFTEDAILVNQKGLFSGRQAIEAYYADLFTGAHFFEMIQKEDKNSPLTIDGVGNYIWRHGECQETFQPQSGGPICNLSSYWSWVVGREGDTWKIRLATSWGQHIVTITPPSPKTTH